MTPTVNLDGSTEIEFWGDARYCWPRDLLKAAGLRREAVDYLTTIGLPLEDDWTLTIVPAEAGAKPTIADGCFVVAREDDPIGVDLRDGCVYGVPGNRPRWFVNSTVPLFGRFLWIYERYRWRVSGVEDDAVAHAIIDDTEREWKAADPLALVEAESYWSNILFQMRHGML